MATDIRLKKSSVAGRIPDSSNLDYGELAINYQDGRLYYKSASGGVKTFLDSDNIQSAIISKTGLDSALTISLIDSTYLKGIIDSSYIQAQQDNLDSDAVIQLIDSDYVRARAQDSSFVTSLIDSNYIRIRQDNLDSSAVIQLIDSDYIANRSAATFPVLDSAGSVKHNQRINFVTPLNDDGEVTLAAQLHILDSAGDSDYIIDLDFKGAGGGGVDSASTLQLIDSDYLKGIIDSDYIQGITDSNYVKTFIDSAYVQLVQTSDYLDSSLTVQLIDSAYIQSRQILLDSSLALQLLLDSSEIIELIDSSYIQARQQLVDSASIIALVDSAYVQARQSDFLDSALAIQLIDSDYVAARTSGGGSSSVVNGSVTTHTAYTFAGNDSSTTFTIGNAIDNKAQLYITINGVLQHTDTYSFSGANVTLDSAPLTGDDIEIRLNNTHSTNVTLRDYQSYFYTPDSATASFSGVDNRGNSLQYSRGKVEVYLNGSKLVDSDDYTAQNGSHVVIKGDPVDSGDTLEIISLQAATIYDGVIFSSEKDFTTTNANQIVEEFSKTLYRTVKYTVQVEHDSDNKYHSEEILLTHTGTKVGMTSYAQIYLDSQLGTFDADLLGDKCRLLFTPTYTNTSVKVKAIRTGV